MSHLNTKECIIPLPTGVCSILPINVGSDSHYSRSGFAYVRQMERRLGKAFIRRCDSGVNEVLAVWYWDDGWGIWLAASITMS